MIIRKELINKWENDWKRLKNAGRLPKGYGSSKPITKREYVQRNINAFELPAESLTREIKAIKRQIRNIKTDSPLLKATLAETVKEREFYREAIKSAYKIGDVEKAKAIDRELEALYYREANEADKKDRGAGLRRKIKQYGSNDDIYYRYLGISKYDSVTLSDGTKYSLDDLKEAIEKYNVNIKQEFFDEDITEYKYKTKTYSLFITDKAVPKIDELLRDNKLPERDLEGMKKLMGLVGGNANLRY